MVFHFDPHPDGNISTFCHAAPLPRYDGWRGNPSPTRSEGWKEADMAQPLEMVVLWGYSWIILGIPIYIIAYHHQFW